MKRPSPGVRFDLARVAQRRTVMRSFWTPAGYMMPVVGRPQMPVGRTSPGQTAGVSSHHDSAGGADVSTCRGKDPDAGSCGGRQQREFAVMRSSRAPAPNPPRSRASTAASRCWSFILGRCGRCLLGLVDLVLGESQRAKTVDGARKLNSFGARKVNGCRQFSRGLVRL